MKLVATIKLKLSFNKILFDLMEEYSKCISCISEKGVANNIHNRYKLHHLCYYEAKSQFNLKSQFIINAIRIASQTLKSVKRNKCSNPKFKKYMPLDFDKRTFTFSKDNIRLTTSNDRLEIPIQIPEYYSKYLGWNYQTARLTYDSKLRKMFLHISFRRTFKSISANGNRIGIDLGINHLAVTSRKEFYSSNEIKIQMLKFKRLRTKLQAKGTKSAKKLLRELSGREKRFKAWVNHNISKQIVDNLNESDTIILENLKGIRKIKKNKQMNYWLHNWNFYQLQKFIEYKANQKGIGVIKVNPYNTSKMCSKCESTNTKRQRSFIKCLGCGYSLNADLNASYNLAKHHSISDGVSDFVNNPHISNDDAQAKKLELKMSLGISKKKPECPTALL